MAQTHFCIISTFLLLGKTNSFYILHLFFFYLARCLAPGSWRVYTRVSSRFFDQPGHEMFNRSIINHNFSAYDYHYMRPQNRQQGLWSLKKLTHINQSCWSLHLWILLKLKSEVHFNASFDFHLERSPFLWFLKN